MTARYGSEPWEVGCRQLQRKQWPSVEETSLVQAFHLP
jgi:hypothetical protein